LIRVEATLFLSESFTGCGIRHRAADDSGLFE